MEQTFFTQKEALVEEYRKLDEARKTCMEKLNRLYAEKIMDIMNDHQVSEIVLYDEPIGEYFSGYREKYDDISTLRYFICSRPFSQDYWICRLAIIDNELKMRVQKWIENNETYGEEETLWRSFSEISTIEDLMAKENLIRYLEESDEAYNIVRDHPELLVLNNKQ